MASPEFQSEVHNCKGRFNSFWRHDHCMVFNYCVGLTGMLLIVIPPPPLQFVTWIVFFTSKATLHLAEVLNS